MKRKGGFRRIFRLDVFSARLDALCMQMPVKGRTIDMARRRFQLTEAQERELIGAYANCRDGPTRTRYQAVRMYGIGYPAQEVMNLTGCGRTSLMEWCRKYQAEGIEGLVDRRVGGNRAKLGQAQIEDLRARLQRHSPITLFGAAVARGDGQFWSITDLRRAVQQWYSVCYQSPSSYHRLFDLCGFSYQHPEGVYKLRSSA
jgi:transposase